ncbi:hypothetical protein ARMA_2371 [Ardenticatena maritima]|uniref:Uncharacterized protein n=1 Tax=Ardenticatena maritima TaxID=872965 RepID=A0A0M9UDF1_9CHLR|nr:hypothetical protein ARMA_2371 [Ardenticatena maritima]
MMLILARNGLPSSEKKSSSSLSDSMMPSKMNVPQTKRTPGGTHWSPFFCGVMKYATRWVMRRTSSAGAAGSFVPSGVGTVTSNQRSSESLVVPVPRNCDEAPPLWSPPERWAENVTRKVSGLNCTLTVFSLLISLGLRSLSHSISRNSALVMLGGAGMACLYCSNRKVS